MFKYQQLLAVCMALIALREVVSFSTQYLGNSKHPVLPDHCYHEEYNLTIPALQTIYPIDIEYKCMKVFCRDDYVLEMKHCDRTTPRRNCVETPYDYSKPYPDCCPARTCTANCDDGTQRSTEISRIRNTKKLKLTSSSKNSDYLLVKKVEQRE